MLVICNGMKRSGSTLQYNWVIALLRNTLGCKNEGFYTKEKYLNNKDIFNNWIKDTEYHVIKTHNFLLIENLNKELKDGRIKIVYIFRDIRDVALSLKKKMCINWDNIFYIISELITVYYEIYKLENIVIHKYEEIINFKKSALYEICNYLNIEIKDYILEQIINETSIENMKRKIYDMNRSHVYNINIYYIFKEIRKFIKKFGFNISFKKFNFLKKDIDNESQLHSDHISNNKGKPYTWREELPEDIIDILNNTYKSWLLKNNYKYIN